MTAFGFNVFHPSHHAVATSNANVLLRHPRNAPRSRSPYPMKRTKSSLLVPSDLAPSLSPNHRPRGLVHSSRRTVARRVPLVAPAGRRAPIPTSFRPARARVLPRFGRTRSWTSRQRSSLSSNVRRPPSNARARASLLVPLLVLRSVRWALA